MLPSLKDRLDLSGYVPGVHCKGGKIFRFYRPSTIFSSCSAFIAVSFLPSRASWIAAIVSSLGTSASFAVCDALQLRLRSGFKNLSTIHKNLRKKCYLCVNLHTGRYSLGCSSYPSKSTRLAVEGPLGGGPSHFSHFSIRILTASSSLATLSSSSSSLPFFP